MSLLFDILDERNFFIVITEFALFLDKKLSDHNLLYILKEVSRRARHVRSKDHRARHQVREALKKTKNKGYESILDRLQNQESCRNSQIDIWWTEDFCKSLNV